MNDEKNLMQEMREKYYPYHKQSKNLIEALDFIKDDMERGCSFTDFWDYWTDLPDDWVIEHDTLKKLQEQGFKVTKRWIDKGKPGEHYYFIVSWDEYEEWPYDEEYKGW